MQVLQWMEGAGIQPSYGMFRDIVSFAQTRGGAEYAAIIQERIGKLILFLTRKSKICFILSVFLQLMWDLFPITMSSAKAPYSWWILFFFASATVEGIEFREPDCTKNLKRIIWREGCMICITVIPFSSHAILSQWMVGNMSCCSFYPRWEPV